jgi:hypothetical protein
MARRLGAASAGFGAVARAAERWLQRRVGSERGHAAVARGSASTGANAVACSGAGAEQRARARMRWHARARARNSELVGVGQRRAVTNFGEEG